jgi:hypothetical protein
MSRKSYRRRDIRARESQPVSPLSAATLPGGDDRLPFVARLGFTPLAFFTAVFGPMLLLRPGATADYWAWPIAPEMSAVWVGAGYTFGALAITTMLVAGRWTAAIVPVVATWPFAVVMLAATVIHNDRFFTDSAGYFIWLAIYVLLPVALPVMYHAGRKHNPAPHARDLPMPAGLCRVLTLAGVIALALGLAMVLAPGLLDQSWPWPLTPLMSRVIGGWVLFLAAGALCTLFERRYAAYRLYLPVAGVWLAILFVASLFHTSDFRDGLATPLYFVVVAATAALLLCLFLYLELLQQVRAHAYAAAVAQFQDAEKNKRR